VSAGASAASIQRHLLGVWNPSYEADAMDAHVAVLLRQARAAREKGDDDGDDVYVWWGKLRSPYRQAPLPHLPEILALDDTLSRDDGAERELHLYLTDYRSLYVAHVAGITGEDIRDVAAEREFVPDYYYEIDKPADCWFQLWDIRRLVLDDTPAVIAELRNLRNVHYHDQRVSLYGGMVNLPLIVTRPDGARWFDERTREQLTGGRHWVEYDAERSAGTGAMQRELRENRFGNAAWSNLRPAARQFIASAEQTFRAHRDDASFDLASVLVELAKGVEVQANAIMRAALADAPDDVRIANVDGSSRDLVDDGPWTLGALARAIGDDRERHLWWQRVLVRGEWFATALPGLLEELLKVRNPAAHGGEPVSRERVIEMRDAMIGVGCKGWLLDLASVRMKP
jgi:hypothetical protein